MLVQDPFALVTPYNTLLIETAAPEIGLPDVQSVTMTMPLPRGDVVQVPAPKLNFPIFVCQLNDVEPAG